MNKNLVVYFSHNKENYVSGNIVNLPIGNTKVVAQKLKDILSADLFEIEPLHEYPAVYRECTDQAKKERNEDARPKIKDYVADIAQYDNIYLGYPNWWSTMPMCVWTFLEMHNLEGKNIYPFCTHEGSGLGRSVEDIKKLCPYSNVKKGLAIVGGTVQNCDSTLNNWVKEVI